MATLLISDKQRQKTSRSLIYNRYGPYDIDWVKIKVYVRNMSADKMLRDRRIKLSIKRGV